MFAEVIYFGANFHAERSRSRVLDFQSVADRSQFARQIFSTSSAAALSIKRIIAGVAKTFKLPEPSATAVFFSVTNSSAAFVMPIKFS